MRRPGVRASPRVAPAGAVFVNAGTTTSLPSRPRSSDSVPPRTASVERVQPSRHRLDSAAGGKAEVEGLITAKGGASITVTQQGKGDYLCDVAAGTPIRKGNTSYTFAQLQTGWRVHVKGTQIGLSGTACQVQASEVKVQNN